MMTILPFVLIGLVFSLIVFFICENLSLKHKQKCEIENTEFDINKVYLCLEQYKTLQYAGIFFILVFIYTLIIAYLDFIPHNLGLIEILSYIFTTAFLGSLYIIIFKWNRELLIKVFSSFMFGSLFISASAIGFAVSYLIFK